MASGSRRIHTLGGLDFQALSTHRLLGSVGEVAAEGGGQREPGPLGCGPGMWGGVRAWLRRAGGGTWTGRGRAFGAPPPPRLSGGGRLTALPHEAVAAAGSGSA